MEIRNEAAAAGASEGKHLYGTLLPIIMCSSRYNNGMPISSRHL